MFHTWQPSPSAPDAQERLLTTHPSSAAIDWKSAFVHQQPAQCSLRQGWKTAALLALGEKVYEISSVCKAQFWVTNRKREHPLCRFNTRPGLLVWRQDIEWCSEARSLVPSLQRSSAKYKEGQRYEIRAGLRAFAKTNSFSVTFQLQ